VDPEGITAQEILSYLRVHGQRSLPQLGRELTLDVKLVTAYVKVLESKRWVETKRDRRGMLFAYAPDAQETVAKPNPFDTPSRGTQIA